MKKFENQKGITLVALVVTIIVLLILAGVSLSLVVGSNGIIDKASTAAERTNTAALKEKVELKLAETATAYFYNRYSPDSESDRVSSTTTLFSYLQTNVTAVEGHTVTITPGEGENANATISVKTTAEVPEEVLSGTISKEGTVDWN